MADTPRLSLGVDETEPAVVDVFGKPFTLRRVTRSVEKALTQADRDMQSFGKDDDVNGDNVVAVLADILDALLAPDGGHRTSAKKLVMDQWNADNLSLDQIQKFSDDLHEQAIGTRPT